MTERWKCPDCKGWVADTVPVHHCSTVTATGGTIVNGYTCGACGTWVPTGTLHSCGKRVVYGNLTVGDPMAPGWS
jgi:hypothetical protein